MVICLAKFIAPMAVAETDNRIVLLRRLVSALRSHSGA